MYIMFFVCLPIGMQYNCYYVVWLAHLRFEFTAFDPLLFASDVIMTCLSVLLHHFNPCLVWALSVSAGVWAVRLPSLWDHLANMILASRFLDLFYHVLGRIHGMFWGADGNFRVGG